MPNWPWYHPSMTTSMTQEARIRRLRDTLFIAGGAVIAFSVWALAKTALLLFISNDEQLSSSFGITGDVPAWIVITVALVFLTIDLVFRGYVGLSARAEGRGKKKGPFYLIVATLAAIGNATSAFGAAFGTAMAASVFDAVVTIVIEATSLIALILVIYCSIRLRSLRKAAG